MSVIASFLSDCARRGRWSRGLIALQGMSIELETNTLIQQAALKYALSAAITHPEISLSLLHPTYIFSHTKLVCELVEILSRSKRVHSTTKEEPSSSTNLLNSEHLEEKYYTFLLESMQLCKAKYCQESHKQKLKSEYATGVDENLELCSGTMTVSDRKRDEVLHKNTCESCSTSTSIETSSLSSATRTTPEMKCSTSSSSEYISTHETEVQNALFISSTHWCDWNIAERLYNQLICPSEASKKQFKLLYKFALQTWHECGSFSSYIQWFYAIEQSKLHKPNKEYFQEEMLPLNTAHKNCFYKTCTSSDEVVSGECLTREVIETQQRTNVINNNDNTNSGRNTTTKRKSRASLELERLRREEELKQKYMYLCELITLGLSNSPSVISSTFLLRCATRSIITTNNTQHLLTNTVCYNEEGNVIIPTLPTITLRMALLSVESHYITNELMLWYLRCIGLCAPWLAQVALEAVQFDERVRYTKGNSCICDAPQGNNGTTDNEKCEEKSKYENVYSDMDKCTPEHNIHAVNSYDSTLSMMLVRLWLLSRSNWQAASLYLNELHEVVNNATKRLAQASNTNKTERVDKVVIKHDTYNNGTNHSVDFNVQNNITNNNLETSSSKQNSDFSSSSNQTTIKLELREEWSMEEEELFWECAEDMISRTAMPRSVFFTHFPHKGQPNVKLIAPTRRGVAHALAHGWRIEKIELSRLYKHWSTKSHWKEMLYLYRRIPTPEFQKRLVHVLLRLHPCIAELDDTFQHELATSCEENNNITNTTTNNNKNSHDYLVESVITAEHVITLICGPKNNILAPCAGSIIALIASCVPSDWVRALQLFRRCVRAGGVCTPAVLSTIMNTNIPSYEVETLLTNYSSAVNNGIRRRAL